MSANEKKAASEETLSDLSTLAETCLGLDTRRATRISRTRALALAFAPRTTTPAQTEETAVANLAIDNSPPKDNSESEEEADFTIAEVDPNDI